MAGAIYIACPVGECFQRLVPNPALCQVSLEQHRIRVYPTANESGGFSGISMRDLNTVFALKRKRWVKSVRYLGK